MKTITIPQEENGISFSSALTGCWLKDPSFNRRVSQFVSATRLRKLLENAAAGSAASVLDEDWQALKGVVEADKNPNRIVLGKAVLDAK